MTQPTHLAITPMAANYSGSEPNTAMTAGSSASSQRSGRGGGPYSRAFHSTSSLASPPSSQLQPSPSPVSPAQVPQVTPIRGSHQLGQRSQLFTTPEEARSLGRGVLVEPASASSSQQPPVRAFSLSDSDGSPSPDFPTDRPHLPRATPPPARLPQEEPSAEYLSTAPMIEARRELRSHPGVVAWLNVFWRTFPMKASVGINKQQYLTQHALMYKALHSTYSPKDMYEQGLNDWARDVWFSPSPHYLDEESYRDALFEVVDLWTLTVEADEYIHFLADLYNRITDLQSWIDPVTKKIVTKYVWKRLKYVACAQVYSNFHYQSVKSNAWKEAVDVAHLLEDEYEGRRMHRTGQDTIAAQQRAHAQGLFRGGITPGLYNSQYDHDEDDTGHPGAMIDPTQILAFLPPPPLQPPSEEFLYPPAMIPKHPKLPMFSDPLKELGITVLNSVESDEETDQEDADEEYFKSLEKEHSSGLTNIDVPDSPKSSSTKKTGKNAKKPAEVEVEEPTDAEVETYLKEQGGGAGGKASKGGGRNASLKALLISHARVVLKQRKRDQVVTMAQQYQTVLNSREDDELAPQIVVHEPTKHVQATASFSTFQFGPASDASGQRGGFESVTSPSVGRLMQVTMRSPEELARRKQEYEAALRAEEDAAQLAEAQSMATRLGLPLPSPTAITTAAVTAVAPAASASELPPSTIPEGETAAASTEAEVVAVLQDPSELEPAWSSEPTPSTTTTVVEPATLTADTTEPPKKEELSQPPVTSTEEDVITPEQLQPSSEQDQTTTIVGADANTDVPAESDSTNVFSLEQADLAYLADELPPDHTIVNPISSGSRSDHHGHSRRFTFLGGLSRMPSLLRAGSSLSLRRSVISPTPKSPNFPAGVNPFAKMMTVAAAMKHKRANSWPGSETLDEHRPSPLEAQLTKLQQEHQQTIFSQRAASKSPLFSSTASSGVLPVIGLGDDDDADVDDDEEDDLVMPPALALHARRPNSGGSTPSGLNRRPSSLARVASPINRRNSSRRSIYATTGFGLTNRPPPFLALAALKEEYVLPSSGFSARQKTPVVQIDVEDLRRKREARAAAALAAAQAASAGTAPVVEADATASSDQAAADAALGEMHDFVTSLDAARPGSSSSARRSHRPTSKGGSRSTKKKGVTLAALGEDQEGFVEEEGDVGIVIDPSALDLYDAEDGVHFDPAATAGLPDEPDVDEEIEGVHAHGGCPSPSHVGPLAAYRRVDSQRALALEWFWGKVNGKQRLIVSLESNTTREVRVLDNKIHEENIKIAAKKKAKKLEKQEKSKNRKRVTSKKISQHQTQLQDVFAQSIEKAIKSSEVEVAEPSDAVDDAPTDPADDEAEFFALQEALGLSNWESQCTMWTNKYASRWKGIVLKFKRIHAQTHAQAEGRKLLTSADGRLSTPSDASKTLDPAAQAAEKAFWATLSDQEAQRRVDRQLKLQHDAAKAALTITITSPPTSPTLDSAGSGDAPTGKKKSRLSKKRATMKEGGLEEAVVDEKKKSKKVKKQLKRQQSAESTAVADGTNSRSQSRRGSGVISPTELKKAAKAARKLKKKAKREKKVKEAEAGVIAVEERTPLEGTKPSDAITSSSSLSSSHNRHSSLPAAGPSGERVKAARSVSLDPESITYKEVQAASRDASRVNSRQPSRRHSPVVSSSSSDSSDSSDSSSSSDSENEADLEALAQFTAEIAAANAAAAAAKAAATAAALLSATSQPTSTVQSRSQSLHPSRGGSPRGGRSRRPSFLNSAHNDGSGTETPKLTREEENAVLINAGIDIKPEFEPPPNSENWTQEQKRAYRENTIALERQTKLLTMHAEGEAAKAEFQWAMKKEEIKEQEVLVDMNYLKAQSAKLKAEQAAAALARAKYLEEKEAARVAEEAKAKAAADFEAKEALRRREEDRKWKEQRTKEMVEQVKRQKAEAKQLAKIMNRAAAASSPTKEVDGGSPAAGTPSKKKKASKKKGPQSETAAAVAALLDGTEPTDSPSKKKKTATPSKKKATAADSTPKPFVSVETPTEKAVRIPAATSPIKPTAVKPKPVIAAVEEPRPAKRLSVFKANPTPSSSSDSKSISSTPATKTPVVKEARIEEETTKKSPTIAAKPPPVTVVKRGSIVLTKPPVLPAAPVKSPVKPVDKFPSKTGPTPTASIQEESSEDEVPEPEDETAPTEDLGELVPIKWEDEEDEKDEQEASPSPQASPVSPSWPPSGETPTFPSAAGQPDAVDESNTTEKQVIAPSITVSIESESTTAIATELESRPVEFVTIPKALSSPISASTTSKNGSEVAATKTKRPPRATPPPAQHTRVKSSEEPDSPVYRSVDDIFDNKAEVEDEVEAIETKPNEHEESTPNVPPTTELPPAVDSPPKGRLGQRRLGASVSSNRAAATKAEALRRSSETTPSSPPPPPAAPTKSFLVSKSRSSLRKSGRKSLRKSRRKTGQKEEDFSHIEQWIPSDGDSDEEPQHDVEEEGTPKEPKEEVVKSGWDVSDDDEVTEAARQPETEEEAATVNAEEGESDVGESTPQPEISESRTPPRKSSSKRSSMPTSSNALTLQTNFQTNVGRRSSMPQALPRVATLRSRPPSQPSRTSPIPPVAETIIPGPVTEVSISFPSNNEPTGENDPNTRPPSITTTTTNEGEYQQVLSHVDATGTPHYFTDTFQQHHHRERSSPPTVSPTPSKPSRPHSAAMMTISAIQTPKQIHPPLPLFDPSVDPTPIQSIHVRRKSSASFRSHYSLDDPSDHGSNHEGDGPAKPVFFEAKKAPTVFGSPPTRHSAGDTWLTSGGDIQEGTNTPHKPTTPLGPGWTMKVTNLRGSVAQVPDDAPSSGSYFPADNTPVRTDLTLANNVRPSPAPSRLKYQLRTVPPPAPDDVLVREPIPSNSFLEARLPSGAQPPFSDQPPPQQQLSQAPVSSASDVALAVAAERRFQARQVDLAERREVLISSESATILAQGKKSWKLWETQAKAASQLAKRFGAVAQRLAEINQSKAELAAKLYRQVVLDKKQVQHQRAARLLELRARLHEESTSHAAAVELRRHQVEDDPEEAAKMQAQHERMMKIQQLHLQIANEQHEQRVQKRVGNPADRERIRQEKWNEFQKDWQARQYDLWKKEVALFQKLQQKQIELARRYAQERHIPMQVLSTNAIEESVSSFNIIDEMLLENDEPKKVMLVIPGANNVVHSKSPLRPVKSTLLEGRDEPTLDQQLHQHQRFPSAAHSEGSQLSELDSFAFEAAIASAANAAPSAATADADQWYQPVEVGAVRKDLAHIFGVAPSAVGEPQQHAEGNVAQKTYIFPRHLPTQQQADVELNATVLSDQEAQKQRIIEVMEAAKREIQEARKAKKLAAATATSHSSTPTISQRSQHQEEKQQVSSPTQNQSTPVRGALKKTPKKGMIRPFVSASVASLLPPPVFDQVEDTSVLEIKSVVAAPRKPLTKIKNAAVVSSTSSSSESVRQVVALPPKVVTEEEKEELIPTVAHRPMVQPQQLAFPSNKFNSAISSPKSILSRTSSMSSLPDSFFPNSMDPQHLADDIRTLSKVISSQNTPLQERDMSTYAAAGENVRHLTFIERGNAELRQKAKEEKERKLQAEGGVTFDTPTLDLFAKPSEPSPINSLFAGSSIDDWLAYIHRDRKARNDALHAEYDQHQRQKNELRIQQFKEFKRRQQEREAALEQAVLSNPIDLNKVLERDQLPPPSSTTISTSTPSTRVSRSRSRPDPVPIQSDPSSIEPAEGDRIGHARRSSLRELLPVVLGQAPAADVDQSLVHHFQPKGAYMIAPTSLVYEANLSPIEKQRLATLEKRGRGQPPRSRSQSRSRSNSPDAHQRGSNSSSPTRAIRTSHIANRLFSPDPPREDQTVGDTGSTGTGLLFKQVRHLHDPPPWQPPETVPAPVSEFASNPNHQPLSPMRAELERMTFQKVQRLKQLESDPFPTHQSPSDAYHLDPDVMHEADPLSPWSSGPTYFTHSNPTASVQHPSDFASSSTTATSSHPIERKSAHVPVPIFRKALPPKPSLAPNPVPFIADGPAIVVEEPLKMETKPTRKGQNRSNSNQVDQVDLVYQPPPPPASDVPPAPSTSLSKSQSARRLQPLDVTPVPNPSIMENRSPMMQHSISSPGLHSPPSSAGSIKSPSLHRISPRTNLAPLTPPTGAMRKVERHSAPATAAAKKKRVQISSPETTTVTSVAAILSASRAATAKTSIPTAHPSGPKPLFVVGPSSSGKSTSIHSSNLPRSSGMNQRSEEGINSPGILHSPIKSSTPSGLLSSFSPAVSSPHSSFGAPTLTIPRLLPPPHRPTPVKLLLTPNMTNNMNNANN